MVDPEKALAPIVFKVFGKVMEVILVNPLNTYAPILVKLLSEAKVTVSIFVDPEKA